ncbi:MAG: DUF3822 family protein [Arachidicoccus sp.]|nr:DUF3822 family protein [Arachidicoccus sp.]
MLQKTFEIHQGKVAANQLHIEVGRKFLALTAFDEKGKASRNFELYDFNEEDDFENILSEIERQSVFLKQQYKEVKIIWENADAQYIPAAFFNDELKNVYYEIIEKKINPQEKKYIRNNDFVIAYTADKKQYELLHKRFSQAKDSHKYFEIVDKVSLPENTFSVNILAIFYQKHFVIAAYKNNVLQFINSVQFSSGTDVAYYLLNAVKQLGTSISDTLISLSGLIDGDSSLFNEINKYVTNIDVDTTPKATFLKENFSEYPSHFFVPFFKYS